MVQHISQRTATQTVQLSIERYCEKCGKTFHPTLQIRGVGHGSANPRQGGAAQAEDAAKAYLKMDIRQQHHDLEKGPVKSATFAVRCPGCGEFTRRAMRKHFPKGFKKGLSSRLMKRLLVNAGLGILPAGYAALAITEPEVIDLRMTSGNSLFQVCWLGFMAIILLWTASNCFVVFPVALLRLQLLKRKQLAQLVYDAYESAGARLDNPFTRRATALSNSQGRKQGNLRQTLADALQRVLWLRR